MFHLLVSYEGWADGGGKIGSGRVYINPDEEPGSQFLTNGKLDLGKVGGIPVLLMSETTGREPRIARVAHITGVQQGPRETSIQYVIDTSVAPMCSDEFVDCTTQLGVRSSLATTHWEVCSGDLYRVLLLIQRKKAERAKLPTATVFSTASVYDQDDDLVSVMMPFKAEFDPVYSALGASTKGQNFRWERADDIWVNHHVIQDIVDLITKARVVVCDCTGRNPNVFYEIGIAHSLGKEVILITQSDDDIPFDLRHLRYVKYLPNKEGLRELGRAVQARIKTVTE